MSRRAADKLVYLGKVTVNGLHASSGQDVSDADTITVEGQVIAKSSEQKPTTIILNKPVSYVC
jgi:16S rRNA U516 pseudouridylate synthase RsuA-like enzyme